MTQIGLLLPGRETSMTGEHDAVGLVRFARAAEDAGFDSVWIGDSPAGTNPSRSAATARRRDYPRVQLGTATLTATLRHPLLGAHTAATVDELGSGRLVLGAGFPLPAYARAWHTLREKTTRSITPALYATSNINPDFAAARTELDGYVRRYFR